MKSLKETRKIIGKGSLSSISNCYLQWALIRLFHQYPEEEADIQISPTKGIQVNRYMQTSDNDIFACGDCAEKVSFFDGKPSNLKLASISTMEARIAASRCKHSERWLTVGLLCYCRVYLI
ncbi:MAG: hypothetical protein PWP27_2170 [Clostridiales bacterium]|nr:hypothetical protein [Clostridiales bacterium]MDK2934360.1 hypothetical protein [Clostridiales bacterium]